MLKRILALFVSATAMGQDAPDWRKLIEPNAERIYPYVVPKEYFSKGEPKPDGITHPLGHDLYVTLVHDLDGRVRNVMPEELAKAGLSVEQAKKKADRNLEILITGGELGGAVFQGPEDKPFVVYGGHWAGAAAITWTGLYDSMRKTLGADELLACIPHRDAMIIFSTGSEEYVKAMQAMILEKEADGRKPLTMKLFWLTKEGPRPRTSKG